MRKCVQQGAGARERPQVQVRGLGHRLWKEQCARAESDARSMHGGGQRVIGTERARSQHARLAARARLTQKQLERAHFVPAVNGRRYVVAFDPDLAVACPQFTRDAVERFDGGRESAQCHARHALRKLRKQFEQRKAHGRRA